LSAWNFPETPFRRIQEDLDELKAQYSRLEHIARGANAALDNCGPGNILRELAKRADRKELDQVKTENAHLKAQMEAMSQELVHKSEEVRKYHSEQAVVFSRIRELLGHPSEIAAKARLYDGLVESGDPVSGRSVIPILVRYTRTIKDLLAEVQKIVPPANPAQKMLFAGPPGSPSGTLYEKVADVTVVQQPPPEGPQSQQGGGSTAGGSRRDPQPARSGVVRRKSTGSLRSGRDQSPVRRSPGRERTPARSRTPPRRSNPGRGSSKDKGKSRAAEESPSDCEMLDSPQPSRAASARDPRTTPAKECVCPATGEDRSPPPGRHDREVSRTPVSRRREESGDSGDEVMPSPNMRRMLTRLMKATPGKQSGSNTGEGSTPKKPRSSE